MSRSVVRVFKRGYRRYFNARVSRVKRLLKYRGMLHSGTIGRRKSSRPRIKCHRLGTRYPKRLSKSTGLCKIRRVIEEEEESASSGDNIAREESDSGATVSGSNSEISSPEIYRSAPSKNRNCSQNVLCEIANCTGSAHIEFVNCAGSAPIEIVNCTGSPPNEIQNCSGSPPREIQIHTGSAPIDIVNCNGSTPSEIRNCIESSPSEIQNCSGSTPREIQIHTGSASSDIESNFTGFSPSEMNSSSLKVSKFQRKTNISILKAVCDRFPLIILTRVDSPDFVAEQVSAETDECSHVSISPQIPRTERKMIGTRALNTQETKETLLHSDPVNDSSKCVHATEEESSRLIPDGPNSSRTSESSETSDLFVVEAQNSKVCSGSEFHNAQPDTDNSRISNSPETSKVLAPSLWETEFAKFCLSLEKERRDTSPVLETRNPVICGNQNFVGFESARPLGKDHISNTDASLLKEPPEVPDCPSISPQDVLSKTYGLECANRSFKPFEESNFADISRRGSPLHSDKWNAADIEVAEIFSNQTKFGLNFDEPKTVTTSPEVITLDLSPEVVSAENQNLQPYLVSYNNSNKKRCHRERKKNFFSSPAEQKMRSCDSSTKHLANPEITTFEPSLIYPRNIPDSYPRRTFISNSAEPKMPFCDQVFHTTEPFCDQVFHATEPFCDQVFHATEPFCDQVFHATEPVKPFSSNVRTSALEPSFIINTNFSSPENYEIFVSGLAGQKISTCVPVTPLSKPENNHPLNFEASAFTPSSMQEQPISAHMNAKIPIFESMQLTSEDSCLNKTPFHPVECDLENYLPWALFNRLLKRANHRISNKFPSAKTQNSSGNDDEYSCDEATDSSELMMTDVPYYTITGGVPADILDEKELTYDNLEVFMQKSTLQSPEAKVCKSPIYQEIEIPSWRCKVFSSCYSMEGTENLSDDVFEKRHARLEAEEKRRKRWDVQRIREQRQLEHLRENERKRNWLAKSDDDNEKDRPRPCSLYPTLTGITRISIDDSLPVNALGVVLKKVEPREFSLPWKDGNTSCGFSYDKESSLAKCRRK